MMNSTLYLQVILAFLVASVLAEEPRNKKEVGYNTPHVQNTDLSKFLLSGGYDHAYYNNPAQSAYYPYNHPQNSNYHPQPYQPYSIQPLTYQPYNGYQLAYQQQRYDNYPYNYQNYPNAFGYPHNAYPSPFGPFPVRQAPIYPSPGAQPISPPVPHPFYHQQGVYYPPQLYPSTTEANKPTTAGPKKNQ